MYCIILIATTATIIIIFIILCVSFNFISLYFFSSSSGLSESEYVRYVFFMVPGLLTLIGSLMVLVSNPSNLCLCSAKGGWRYVGTAIFCIKYT